MGDIAAQILETMSRYNNERHSDLQNRLVQALRDKEELATRKEGELARMRELNAASEEKLHATNAKRARTKEKLDDARCETASLKKGRAELQRKIRSQSDELKRKEQQLAQANATIQSLREDNVTLLDVELTLRRQIADKQDEMTAQQKAFELEIDRLRGD